MAKDAKYWVSRFGVYEGEDHNERAAKVLVQMGARAVPALIAHLGDRKTGWNAAMLLGEIGLPVAKRALPALTRAARAGRADSGDLWAARALGQMGQIETLMAMAGSKKLLPAVVAGLKEARPASYVHFETLCARKDKRLERDIAEALRPGSAAYQPPAASFEQVAAAVGSAHNSLRKDAMLALVEFRGLKAKKRAVELLVPLLADRDPEVRRIAVLGLGWCKSAATPAVPAIEALLRDRNAKVRQFAQLALTYIR